MREYRRSCDGCGEEFSAKSPNARWHSPACKKRNQRHPQPVVEEVAEPVLDVEPPTGLVAAVKSELEAAKVAHTFAGQLAISLAKRLSDPEETGASSLSKELRTVMASALSGVTPPAATEDEDEVAKARSAREHKAREAARRA